MMAPKFTFVVPACNVEPYLTRCIESLKAQTLPDFEALIVCEESKDNTLALACELTAEDKRFQVIELPRSGSASASRNYGIEHAKGDYLVFVDGDDWIDKSSLELFQVEIETHCSPDMLMNSYTNWREDGSKIIETHGEKQLFHYGEIYSGVSILAASLHENLFRSATWICIYRRDFLVRHDLRQQLGRRHQDDEWTPRVYFYAQRILVTDIAYYNYIKRAGSVTTKPSRQSLIDVRLNIESALIFYYLNAFPPALSRQWGRTMCSNIVCFLDRRWRENFDRVVRKEEFMKLFSVKLNRKIFYMLMRSAPRGDRLFALIVIWTYRLPFLYPICEKLTDFIYKRGRKK